MSDDALPDLLWPLPARHRLRAPIRDAEELGLTQIARAIDSDGQHGRAILATLLDPPCDEPTIRYRQQIVQVFLDSPERTAAAQALLPHLRGLAEAPTFQHLNDESPLTQITGRLGELEQYIAVVERLWHLLADIGDSAIGLAALRDAIATRRTDPAFQRLASELPAIRAEMEQVASITIGINLDAQLRPESAVILDIGPQRAGGRRGILERLFGAPAEQDAMRGITALYPASEQHTGTSEHTLFRDLSRMIGRVATPVASFLRQYQRINTRSLAALAPDLAWYAGAAALFSRLRAEGCSFCLPDLAAPEARQTVIGGAYSLDLALRRRNQSAALPVPNDVDLVSNRPIAFITGPNSGGKTTYLRTVGQAHILAQAGLPIPGTYATISPANAILTHFAAQEHPQYDMGRLEEELQRLAEMVQHATPESLLLLNEPLTTTDYRSALLIGRDLVYGLRQLGARVIFVTHLHVLVEEQLVPAPPLTNCSSLVAGITAVDGTSAPSYYVVPAEPRLQSLAAERAAAYGLRRDQLQQRFQAIAHESRQNSS